MESKLKENSVMAVYPLKKTIRIVIKMTKKKYKTPVCVLKYA